jgi:hypothetical protein
MCSLVFNTILNREQIVGHGLVCKLVNEGRHHIHGTIRYEERRWRPISRFLIGCLSQDKS